MRVTLSLLCSLLALTVHAKDGNDDDDDAPSTSAANPSATPSSSSSPLSNPSNSTTSGLIGMTGGVTCTDLLCIGGLVNGSNIQYTLQSINAAKLGWMAIGFGTQMANTPMVIMWPNADGSYTLSQRTAPAEVMPTVVADPTRVATMQPTLSVASGNNPKLTFTISSDGATKKNIIWAFGGTNPDDSAVDAMLLQHLDSGPTTIDLSPTLAAGSKDPTNPVSTIAQSQSGGSGSSGSDTGSGSGSGNKQPATGVPLLTYEKYIIAHGILCTIGFLFLLPLGAILARLMRTFSPFWFQLHWIIQFALALPIIVAGVACGIAAVNKQDEGVHLNDTHKKWGIAIFVLYFVQLSLGGIIHFLKPRSLFMGIRGRPVQNYFHAIVGILLIGVSFYQVRTGFRVEWPMYTGRGKVRNGANIAWIIWLVLVPVFYFTGLFLLRRQYRQEAADRKVEQGGVETY